MTSEPGVNNKPVSYTASCPASKATISLLSADANAMIVGEGPGERGRMRFGEKGVFVDLKARRSSESGEHMREEEVMAANQPLELEVAKSR